MRAILFAAAALATVGSPAVAVDWRVVSVDRYSVIALDADGMRPTAARTTGWVAIVLPETTDEVDYFLVRYEWNCNEYSHVQTSLASYSADGFMVNRSDSRQPSEVVAPGTNADRMMDAVCQNIFGYEGDGWPTISGLLADYRTSLE